VIDVRWVKISLTVCNGTAIAMMLRMHPEPKSKNRLPLPSSTMMQVPACAFVTGIGAADERDPHFVGSNLFLARVVDVVADEIGRHRHCGGNVIPPPGTPP
jgi:hypothetical protein